MSLLRIFFAAAATGVINKKRKTISPRRAAGYNARMIRSFQFRLKTLMAVTLAACVIIHVVQIVARDLAGGRISDLPIADRQGLDVIAAQGIAVVDRFT